MKQSFITPGMLISLFPFILLSPLIAVRFVLHIIIEFPKVLYVVALVLALGLALPDLMPATAAVEEVEAVEYVLSEQLGQCRVQVERKGKKPLRLKGKGPVFSSPKLPAWNWVGPRPARVKIPKKHKLWLWAATGNDHTMATSCIWVHPPGDGKLVVEFTDAPSGERVVGFVHFLRSAAKDAAVTVTVKQGKKTVKRLKPKAASGSAWEFEVDLKKKRGGSLTFVFEAGKRAKNHICFDAVVL